MSEPVRIYWAVMSIQKWASINICGIPLSAPPEGPHYFCPIFKTREQAVAWAGSEEHVTEIVVLPPEESRVAREGKAG
jgi:hypothetical protein